jgi:hypothetical protein
VSLRNKLLALLTWHTGPEVRSTQNRMEPPPQPIRTPSPRCPIAAQAALLDALAESIYTQPPTDWSKVTNLGQMRAVPEVKNTVNLAQQYADLGYDPDALISRLATIVVHDNFTEMHAFKHHQATFEEFHATALPWRWRHLVSAAQASAISYGKNMEIYERRSSSCTTSLPSRCSGRGVLRADRAPLPDRSLRPHQLTSMRASTTMRRDILEVPRVTVEELDRDLDDVCPRARRSIRHLDLEGIPVGPDGREIELGDEPGAVGAEPGRRIGERQRQRPARIPVAPARQGTAAQGPPGIDPPRTYRDPMARSAPSSITRNRCGSAAGSWERSLSISTRTWIPAGVPRRTHRGTQTPTPICLRARARRCWPSVAPLARAISAVPSGLASSDDQQIRRGHGGSQLPQDRRDVGGFVVGR